MAGKNVTQVIIDGKVLHLSGYEDAEYLQRVASYINKKIQEIDGELKGKFIGSDMRASLIEINIADELLKLRDTVDLMDADLQEREEELKMAKQELASLQVRCENLEKENQKHRNKKENAHA